MKTLRQFTVSAVLVLVIALPALGGDMHCPIVAPPPPPPQSETAAEPYSGSDDASLGVETGELDPLTEATLLMLQGVLALF